MRVYFGCRDRLGDILAEFFCPITFGRRNRTAELMMRLRNACKAGACESAMAISTFGFWEHMDFPLRVQHPSNFDVPLPELGYGRSRLVGYQNLLAPPRELLTFPAEPRLQLPMRPPIWPIPKRFILFSDGAGSLDRALTDPRIIEWLKHFLPVIRIGRSGGYYKLPMGGRGSTSADLDLTDRTDLTEVFWLAKHARIIVSSCTFLRAMSSLTGTPVIEFLQADRARASTFVRTDHEYSRKEFGMTDQLNRWYVWDKGSTVPMAREWVEDWLVSRCS